MDKELTWAQAVTMLLIVLVVVVSVPLIAAEITQ